MMSSCIFGSIPLRASGALVEEDDDGVDEDGLPFRSLNGVFDEVEDRAIPLMINKRSTDCPQNRIISIEKEGID